MSLYACVCVGYATNGGLAITRVTDQLLSGMILQRCSWGPWWIVKKATVLNEMPVLIEIVSIMIPIQPIVAYIYIYIHTYIELFIYIFMYKLLLTVCVILLKLA